MTIALLFDNGQAGSTANKYFTQVSQMSKMTAPPPFILISF